LERLAKNGLSRQDFQPTELICDQDSADELNSIDFMSDVVHWLADEGIIRFEAVLMDGEVIGATLTSKGFSALGKPAISGDSRSLGFAVRQIQSGSGGFANVGELFGGILGAFTKSISGN